MDSTSVGDRPAVTNRKTAPAKPAASATGRRKKKQQRTPTLTAEDWLQAALEVLDQRGIDSVKVLTLAGELGVTRGSFYWHFENREDLLRQMLTYWEKALTDVVIHQANAVNGPVRSQLQVVMTNVLINRQERYDSAVILWSRVDKEAARAYRRTMRKRLQFIQNLVEQAGIDSETAAFRAKIAYSWLTMMREGLPRLSKKQLLEEIEMCVDLALSK